MQPASSVFFSFMLQKLSGVIRSGHVFGVVIDIFWESTLVFFVAYKPANNGNMEQPWLVQVTLTVSSR